MVCKSPGCPFEAYVSYDKKVATYILRRFEQQHTCVGALEQRGGTLHSVKYASARVKDGMTITRQTTPAQVIAWYRDHHGSLQYHTALQVLQGLRGDEHSVQAQQFGYLASYARHILHIDQGATSKLQNTRGRFQSLFIAPSTSTAAWPHLRPFLAVDAAWTKVVHQYVLLIATGLEANNQGINLAWGIAPKESLDHWAWFFDNLLLALPDLDRPQTIIMSNRQKGLNRAVETHLPLATEAYCCKHIERNLVGEFGKEVAAGFWRAVYARTKEKFEEAMSALKRWNPRCHLHLHAIPHRFWADYALPAPRYGQHTSNIVEQQNWVYIEAREMPVLDMFTHIWQDVQKKRFDRHTAAEAANTPLLPHAITFYRQNDDLSRLYNAVPSSNTSGLVYLRQDREKEFKVDLFHAGTASTGVCTCGGFQDNRMPCPHGLALLLELRLPPLQFVGSFWTKAAWSKCYGRPVPPLLRSELVLDPTVLPPTVKKAKGRRQKKRREQGTQSGAAATSRLDLTAQSSEAAAEPLTNSGDALPSRKRRQKFNPYVYIVDTPRSELPVTSRTRSGLLR